MVGTAFTEEQNSIALIAKAIGHPARVAILQHLIKINACICGDLVEENGLTYLQIKKDKQKQLIAKDEILSSYNFV